MEKAIRFIEDSYNSDIGITVENFLVIRSLSKRVRLRAVIGAIENLSIDKTKHANLLTLKRGRLNIRGIKYNITALGRPSYEERNIIKIFCTSNKKYTINEKFKVPVILDSSELPSLIFITRLNFSEINLGEHLKKRVIFIDLDELHDDDFKVFLSEIKGIKNDWLSRVPIK